MECATLIRMANQIALNLAVQGEQAAVDGTVQHLIDFWDPRMLSAIAQAQQDAMDPIVRAAIGRICATRQLGIVRPDGTLAF